MEDYIIDFIYFKDKDTYYDKRTKRTCNYETALYKLREYDEGLPTSTAKKLLNDKKLEGVNSYEYLGKEQIPGSKLYNEVKEHIPYKYYITDTLETINYYVNGSEARVISGNDDDKLFNGINKNKELYDLFYNKYTDSEIVNKLKRKLTFPEYMNALFKEYRTDPEKRIDKEPELLSWNPNVLAFRQFDEKLLKDAPTPTWDEFLKRLDFPDIFMAWVWTVFEPLNKTRQVLWLRGGGNDGKSSVMNAITEIYGAHAAATLSQGSETRQWFYSTIYGKRLVTYPDTLNVHLLENTFMKSATTGDRVPVEFKNENVFHGYIYAKFMISSNPPPSISLANRAAVTRLIKLEVKKIPSGGKKDYNFTKRLIEEGYAFLYKCKQSFERNVNPEELTEILLPEELIERIEADCASSKYNILSEFIENTLEFSPKYFYRKTEFLLDLGAHIARYNEPGSKVPYYISDFKEREIELGFSERRLTLDGERANLYIGFRKKGSTNELK